MNRNVNATWRWMDGAKNFGGFSSSKNLNVNRRSAPLPIFVSSV